MSGLDDWLYILIFVGVALFQVVKKKLEVHEESGDESKPTSPPVIPFPPFQTMEQEVQVPTVKENKRTKRSKSPQQGYVSISESRALGEPQSDGSVSELEPNGGMKPVEPEFDPSLYAPDLSDEEQVKRGIIFSEIFQPKFKSNY